MTASRARDADGRFIGPKSKARYVAERLFGDQPIDDRTPEDFEVELREAARRGKRSKT